MLKILKNCKEIILKKIKPKEIKISEDVNDNPNNQGKAAGIKRKLPLNKGKLMKHLPALSVLTVAIIVFIVSVAFAFKEEAKYECILTYEQINELYSQGYGLLDIQRAMEISEETGMEVEELLEMRGTTEDIINEEVDRMSEENKLNGSEKAIDEKADDKTDKIAIREANKKANETTNKKPKKETNNNKLSRSSKEAVKELEDKNPEGKKSWKQIEEELGIYKQKPYEEYGLTEEQNDELIKKGYGFDDIIRIGIILEAADVNYDEIKDEINEKTKDNTEPSGEESVGMPAWEKTLTAKVLEISIKDFPAAKKEKILGEFNLKTETETKETTKGATEAVETKAAETKAGEEAKETESIAGEEAQR